MGYKKNKEQNIFKYMTIDNEKIEGTRTGKTCEEVSKKEKIFDLFKSLNILSIMNKSTEEYTQIFDRKLGMIQRPTEGDNTRDYSYNTTCNELQRRLKQLDEDKINNLRWYFRPYENNIIQNYFKNQ